MNLKELISATAKRRVEAHIPKMSSGLPELSIGGERVASILNVTKDSKQLDAHAALLAHSATHIGPLHAALGKLLLQASMLKNMQLSALQGYALITAIEDASKAWTAADKIPEEYTPRK